MGFFSNLVKVVSDGIENGKYNTKIPQSYLKDILNFADEHKIIKLNFDGCNDWEEYDKKLLAIKILDLSNKNIKEFPYGFFLILEQDKLKSLSLKGNKIEKIDWSFSRLKELDNLKEFDISHNKISEIPDYFQIHHNLEKLNLSHNKVSKLSEEFCLSSHFIKHLDLSYNNFGEYHHGGNGLLPLQVNAQNLETLNLSHNKFSGQFEYDSLIPNVVKDLDLSHNEIRSLWVRVLGDLEVLKINNNKISEKFHPNLKKVFAHANSSYENNPIRDNPEPYEEIDPSSLYINHCFNCKAGIRSDEDEQCDICGFYICSRCGSCFCRK